jgi:hypothetical protein
LPGTPPCPDTCSPRLVPARAPGLQGAKVVQYWRCQHEVFALYGECARWDGLVERLTRFEDDACSLVAEVVETFDRRKDKLRERRCLPTVGGCAATGGGGLGGDDLEAVVRANAAACWPQLLPPPPPP